ncbi:MAG: hypothetical protein EB075_12610, partial [Bacteroidetes bacterium]|nr:hypothetical protein [Bacteroidota bacterium]
MMSDAGRRDFQNQLQQLVGSIQYTNDIDVHIALIQAPSYAKERAEKFHSIAKTNHQIIREYVDLYGICQKNVNALDILIEEGKSVLRQWGVSQDPDFLLTNSKLTFQMQMQPENTQYLTQGPDGARRLKQGPNINSYRGLSVINSRSFHLEDGAPPRDVLRRRVRVAEYYRIPWEPGCEQKHYSLYDESKDAWQRFSWYDLFRMSEAPKHQAKTGPSDSEYHSLVFTSLPDVYNQVPDVVRYTDGTGTKSYQDLMNLWQNPNVSIPSDVWDTRMQRDYSRVKNPVWCAVYATQSMYSDVALTDFKGTIDAILNNPEANTEKVIADIVATNANWLNNRRLMGFSGTTPNMTALLAKGLQAFGFPLPGNIEYSYAFYDEWTNAAGDFREAFNRFLLGDTSDMDPLQKQFFLELAWFTPQSNPLEYYIYSIYWNNEKIPMKPVEPNRYELVIIRPNIEHSMLGVVMGRGGLDLGATFWGQTELSCYDD